MGSFLCLYRMGKKNLNALAAGIRGAPVLSIVIKMFSDFSNFFNDIAIKFSAEGAEALFTHLESPEGGSLKVVRSKEHTHLAIIRYVKGVSDMKHTNTHYFRSVVWNTESNRPVSFSNRLRTYHFAVDSSQEPSANTRGPTAQTLKQGIFYDDRQL